MKPPARIQPRQQDATDPSTAAYSADQVPALKAPYWRCKCGTTAMPLTDDTTCLCIDIYEQDWELIEAADLHEHALSTQDGNRTNTLCSDCPPEDYPTGRTRCIGCPRLPLAPSPAPGGAP